MRRRKAGVVSVARRQTGRSNQVHDAYYHALLPGYRISASGNLYYEARKNRSDRHGRRR